MADRIKILQEQIATIKYQLTHEESNKRLVESASKWGERNGDENFYRSELQAVNQRINQLKYRIDQRNLTINQLQEEARQIARDAAAAKLREEQARARRYQPGHWPYGVLQVKVQEAKVQEWPALVPILKPIPKRRPGF